jgi:hypothetical protein
VRLTGGKVYTVFWSLGVTWLRGGLWDGSSWSSYETICDYQVAYPSAYAYGDDVYCVYSVLSAGYYYCKFRKRTYGVGWGSEESASSTPTRDDQHVTVDSSNGDCWVFWVSGLDNLKLVYAKRVNSTGAWSTVEWITEPAPNSIMDLSVCPYWIVMDSEIGVAYVRGATAPYTLRFAVLSLVPLIVKKPIMNGFVYIE